MQYSEFIQNLKKIIFTGIVLVFLPYTSAQALDQNTFINSLRASVKPYELEISSDAVQQINNNYIIKEATIKDRDRVFFDSLKLTNINIKGVDETDTGYSINSFGIGTVSTEVEKTAIELTRLEVDNLTLPKNGNAKTLSTLPAEKLIIANIVLKTQNKDLLTANNIEVNSSPESNGIVHKIQVKVPYFKIAVGSFARPNDLEMLKALNLKTLHGNTNYHFTVDKEKGVFSLDDSQIVVDQLGRFRISYNIKLRNDELKAFRQSTIDGIGTKQSRDVAVNGFDYNNLYLQDYTLRYEDQSLVNNALNYFSTETGLPKDSLSALVRSLIVASIPKENMSVTKEVDSALAAFLAKPQSLTIKLNPEQPVSFKTIAELSENNPFAIISRLNLHVSANN